MWQWAASGYAVWPYLQMAGCDYSVPEYRLSLWPHCAPLHRANVRWQTTIPSTQFGIYRGTGQTTGAWTGHMAKLKPSTIERTSLIPVLAPSGCFRARHTTGLNNYKRVQWRHRQERKPLELFLFACLGTPDDSYSWYVENVWWMTGRACCSWGKHPQHWRSD